MSHIGEDGQPIHEEPESHELADIKYDQDGNPIQDIENADNEDSEDKVESVSEDARTRRFATIMNLVNSVIGAGILGVPNTMKKCGIFPSVFLIIVVAFMNYSGSVITVTKQKETLSTGFDDLSQRVLGKIGSIICSISILIFGYSCLVAYLIIARDNITSVISLCGVKIKTSFQKALVVLINGVLVPVPLTFPRNIAFLSKFALINLLCVTFYLIVIVIKAIVIIPKEGSGPNVLLAKFDLGLFSAISVYALAFCLPSVILPIIKPYNPDLHKRNVVSGAAMTVCALFVLIPGILAYITKGENVKSSILLSYSYKDPLIVILNICFYFVTQFAYPAIAASAGSSWSKMLYKHNDLSTLETSKRIVVLILLNVISVAIAMILPNITPALSIGGALGGALSSFVFPPAIWLKLSDIPLSSPKSILMIGYFLLGLALTILCTYQSIVDAIKEF